MGGSFYLKNHPSTENTELENNEWLNNWKHFVFASRVFPSLDFSLIFHHQSGLPIVLQLQTRESAIRPFRIHKRHLRLAGVAVIDIDIPPIQKAQSVYSVLDSWPRMAVRIRTRGFRSTGGTLFCHATRERFSLLVSPNLAPHITSHFMHFIFIHDPQLHLTQVLHHLIQLFELIMIHCCCCFVYFNDSTLI